MTAETAATAERAADAGRASVSTPAAPAATVGAAGAVDPAAWSCPAPLRDSPTVVMGHGGGGAMSAELVEHLFLPAFGEVAADELGDSAVLAVGSARLAFSTDSYVVRPMFFPGGSIGDLAVNGTVNDLAMAGARPLCLSTAFILEEGTPLADLARIAADIGVAARQVGVRLATGDTKVVDAGHGHGVFVNTSGIGLIPDGVDIRPTRVRPGDVVLVSGDLGVHGVAVLSCREGLEFGTALESDTAPLHGLVAAMLDTGLDGRGGAPGRTLVAGHPDGAPRPVLRADVHALRDPTRGGLAASLNEIARAAGVGVDLVERSVPVPAAVADACGILGLDPLYVANEGKLVAFVAREDADRVLAAMRDHPRGRGATVIGTVVEEHPGLVVARTAFGTTRVIDMPIGEQLPRIC